ncbi:TIGR01212 family radical SAM protein [Candidatus Auribacterota bacterium]
MKRYNSFSDYLKKKYGCKVYKVSIDAGFTCPTRDGTRSDKGCIYCDDTGSRAPYCDRSLDIGDQVRRGIELMKKRYKARKFMAYFQAYSNTYAPAHELKEIYDRALIDGDIVGLSISTRPDCVNRENVEVIGDYARKYEVWIELGFQSFNDRTLKAINRGHGANENYKAVELIKKNGGIKICGHIILGLPGEENKDHIAAAKEINRLGIDGVKIHNLHILKETTAEHMYRKGEIRLPGMDEYVGSVCDLLEHIDPKIIIQRLTGDASPERLIAPEWTNQKAVILKMIDEELERRGSKQGADRA